MVSTASLKLVHPTIVLLLMCSLEWYDGEPDVARNAFAGKRSGQATRTHSCDYIRSVPDELTFVIRLTSIFYLN